MQTTSSFGVKAKWRLLNKVNNKFKGRFESHNKDKSYFINKIITQDEMIAAY